MAGSARCGESQMELDVPPSAAHASSIPIIFCGRPALTTGVVNLRVLLGDAHYCLAEKRKAKARHSHKSRNEGVVDGVGRSTAGKPNSNTEDDDDGVTPEKRESIYRVCSSEGLPSGCYHVKPQRHYWVMFADRGKDKGGERAKMHAETSSSPASSRGTVTAATARAAPTRRKESKRSVERASPTPASLPQASRTSPSETGDVAQEKEDRRFASETLHLPKPTDDVVGEVETTLVELFFASERVTEVSTEGTGSQVVSAAADEVATVKDCLPEHPERHDDAEEDISLIVCHAAASASSAPINPPKKRGRDARGDVEAFLPPPPKQSPRQSSQTSVGRSPTASRASPVRSSPGLGSDVAVVMRDEKELNSQPLHGAQAATLTSTAPTVRKATLHRKPTPPDTRPSPQTSPEQNSGAPPEMKYPAHCSAAVSMGSNAQFSADPPRKSQRTHALMANTTPVTSVHDPSPAHSPSLTRHQATPPPSPLPLKPVPNHHGRLPTGMGAASEKVGSPLPLVGSGSALTDSPAHDVVQNVLYNNPSSGGEAGELHSKAAATSLHPSSSTSTTLSRPPRQDETPTIRADIGQAPPLSPPLLRQPQKSSSLEADLRGSSLRSPDLLDKGGDGIRVFVPTGSPALGFTQVHNTLAEEFSLDPSGTESSSGASEYLYDV